MINFFRRKYKITLINDKWEIKESNLKLAHIPRYGEFIYLRKKNLYYKVESVIHTIDNKKDIFLVVKIFQQKTIISNNNQ